MSAGPTDRRVRRTRALLLGALLSLVQEKGYDRITIQDILDKADVGRSTFYAHYRDKDDLLRSGFEDIRASLVAEVNAGERAIGRKVEFLRPILAVFQHVEGHRQLWKPLVRKGGADLVIRILREGVADLVQEQFRAQFPQGAEDQTQLEAAMQFVISACMGLLTWWLENDVSYSAEEIHSIFRRLTTQGVRRVLAAA
jgi:AcrR family transcriptional regulator